MASFGCPVVDIPDDDDDDCLDVSAAASPPSSRKRPHASTAVGTSSPDFLDAFSPSPPLQKRLLLSKSPIVLDDTPSPPKRRPSSAAPKLPVLVVDDDTGPEAAPCSLVLGGDDADTPDSVLPCSPCFRSTLSETPDSAEPGSIDIDNVAAGTPGFTSPSLVGPPALHGLSSAAPAHKFSGVSSLISLDSDNESDDTMHWEPLTSSRSNSDPVVGPVTSFYPGKVDSGTSNDRKDYLKSAVGHDTTISTKMPEAKKWQKEDNAEHLEAKQKKRPARLTKEEKAKLMEERNLKREEDKLKKKALKDELADKKKKDKEIQEWASGKYALKCITAEIDPGVVESGSVGGPLLSNLAEKGLSYKVTKNLIGGSILWKMNVPDDIAEALSSLNDSFDTKVAYISVLLQAKEFCDLVSSGSFFNHVQKVRDKYPAFTICYITNKLMNYINKREQIKFKNPLDTWRRPPVEEVLCKLATHYVNVHSRQCIDEAEVAEHLVGLTTNLAKCKFRKPLTWLSVHANGAIIPKGFVDKGLAKKDTWLKALIAIPDIQPRYALAIWKKYPRMRSLLNEYMDPSKTVLEKELLLSDLKWEDRLGNEGKRLGKKCSTRVYRILMAQDGDLDTDSPEAGGAA